MAESSAVGSADKLTPAQRLMQQHTAADGHSHNVQVEEVVDEEDIEHPPPSAQLHGDGQVSEKAEGKRSADGPQPKKGPTLDTQSEASFPALGTPTPRSAVAPPTWSRQPSNISTNNASAKKPDGNAGNGPASAGLVSSSTPMSATGRGPASMSLPGRHTERVQFAPSQLTPRNQLKRPVQDVLRDINKKSKANITMSTGSGGAIVFEGTGPVEAVRQALKEVAKELGSKQSVKIPVPTSVRAHIIGRQGSTIQTVFKRTGARIQMPPASKHEHTDEDDEDTVDVLIEGDAISAEMARREIESIVNEHTSVVNLRMKNIPAEYYPFLAGPNNRNITTLQGDSNLKINIPHYNTWHQDPAQAVNGHAQHHGHGHRHGRRQPANFTAQARNPIQISGDRGAAAQARQAIEQQVEQLRQQLTLDQMAIERGRHQFISGSKGASLQDFLNETGCAVILPPDDHDSEMITIVGPPERLEEGMNKVMDLASSMHMSNVDIARQHPNAPHGAHKHARNINRYLRQKQAMQQLEAMHDAKIMAHVAPDAPTSWEVYSRDAKNGMRARSDIMNLISAHPPARFTPYAVDPFYRQQIDQQAVENIRKAHGVHLVVPEPSEDDDVLLVFEGPEVAEQYEVPRQQPSAAEIQQFGPALLEAQKFLENLIGPQSEVVVRDVQAPTKFHDKIRRHVHKHHKQQRDNYIPVQVRYGAQRGPDASSPLVSMRGPDADVENMMQSLLAFIAQEESDELERGFTLTFEFPQKHANQLIGKSGANIRKIREEFDVEIQVDEGKVTVQGPEAKANACKAHILALGRKLDDEATHVIKVKPQFHREMKGMKGAQVNRLQDRYDVKINFPRTAASSQDTDAGDAGDQRRNDQAPDEVIIRGPKRGADAAREELLSLLQYSMETSHTTTVNVAQSHIPRLIGAGGRELEAIRAATGAQIEIPNKEESGSSGQVEIKIKGSKKEVEEAKSALEQASKALASTKTRSIDVDKRHHRNIIGREGANLHDIVVKAGGPQDRREQARMVRFPKSEEEGNSIRLEGPDKVLSSIVEQIQAMVLAKDDEVNEIVDVAPEKHRLLIGRGGDIKRKMEGDFGVSIDVPRQHTTGPQRTHVKVRGTAANVKQAIAHIETLVKDREGQTVSVPRKHHHAIADHGQFFRRLRNDHQVSVDHAGQAPPARQASQPTRRQEQLPLITDEAQGSDDAFSWILHELTNDGPEGDIPWVLSGPTPEDVEKARARLETALNEAQLHDSTGYLVVPDPRTYGRVVGPGGAGINKIRRDTKTRINVPKSQTHGEAIEIMGSKDGCEEAKEMIIAAIKAGEQRREYE